MNPCVLGRKAKKRISYDVEEELHVMMRNWKGKIPQMTTNHFTSYNVKYECYDTITWPKLYE